MMVTRMPMLALMASLALMMMIMVRTANGDELGSGVTSSSSEETSTTTTEQQTMTSNTVGSITEEKQQPSSTSKEGLQVEDREEKKEEKGGEKEVKEPAEEGKKEENGGDEKEAEKPEEGKKEVEEGGKMEERKDVKEPLEEDRKEEEEEEEEGDQKEEEAKGEKESAEEGKKEEGEMSQKEGEEAKDEKEEEKDVKGPVEEGKREQEVGDKKEEEGSKEVKNAPEEDKKEEEVERKDQGEEEKKEKEGDKEEEVAAKIESKKEDLKEEKKEEAEGKKEKEEEGKREPEEEEKKKEEGSEREEIKEQEKEEAESKKENTNEGKNEDEEEKEEAKKEEKEGDKKEEEGGNSHRQHHDDGKIGENTSSRLDDQTFEELATSAEPERAETSAKPERAETSAKPEMVTESAKTTKPEEPETSAEPKLPAGKSAEPEMVPESAKTTGPEEPTALLANSAGHEHDTDGQGTSTTTTTTPIIPLVRPVNDGLDHQVQEQEEPNPFASIEAEHFAGKENEKEEEGLERTRMEEIKEARSGEKEGELGTRTEEEKDVIKEEGIGTGSSENGRKDGIQNDDKKEEIGTGRSEKEEEIWTGRSEKEEEKVTNEEGKKEEEKVTNEEGKKEEEIGSGRSEKEEEKVMEKTIMEEIKAISGENKEEVETRTDDKEEEHKTGMSEKEEEEFGIRRDEKEEVGEIRTETTTTMALPAEEDVPETTTSVVLTSVPPIAENGMDEREEIDVPRKDQKEGVGEIRMGTTTTMALPAEEEDIPGTATSGAIIPAEIGTDEKEKVGEIRTDEKEEAIGGMTEPPTTMAMPENDAPEVTTASTPTLVRTTFIPSAEEEKGAFRQEEEQEPVRQITKMPMRPVEEAEQRELALSRAFRTPFLVHLDKIEWRLEFADLSSGPAKKLLDQIHKDLRSAFGNAIGPDFLDYQVEALVKGSVIVEGQLLTREPVDDPQSTVMALEQAILSGGGELGGNSVDTDAISIAGIRANLPSGNIVAANTQRQTEAAVNTGYIIGGAVTVGVLIIIFTIFAIVVFGVNNRRNIGTLKLKEEICMVENGGKGGKFGDTPKRFMNMTNNDDGGVNLTGMRTTRLADGPRPVYGINIQQPVLLISDRPPVITLTSDDQ